MREKIVCIAVYCGIFFIFTPLFFILVGGMVDVWAMLLGYKPPFKAWMTH